MAGNLSPDKTVWTITSDEELITLINLHFVNDRSKITLVTIGYFAILEKSNLVQFVGITSNFVFLVVEDGVVLNLKR